jgi:serine/threonine protein phosphatase 1
MLGFLGPISWEGTARKTKDFIAQALCLDNILMWKPRFFQPRSYPLPRVPAGVRVYAFGDIHGRLDLLDPLLARVDADIASYPVAQPLQIFLGDYIDRGADSFGVLDRLCQREKTGSTICLKGNHEAYFLEFLKNPRVFEAWAKYGALPTLLSYGLQPSNKAALDEQVKLARQLHSAMPIEHKVFLQRLASSFTCADYFFVHAGVRPGYGLSQQSEDDLLWIREDFLLHEERFEKFIVHGHTPVREPDLKPNRINIDTGAYATGKLTCLVLEGDEKRFL